MTISGEVSLNHDSRWRAVLYFKSISIIPSDPTQTGDMVMSEYTRGEESAALTTDRFVFYLACKYAEKCFASFSQFASFDSPQFPLEVAYTGRVKHASQRVVWLTVV